MMKFNLSRKLGELRWTQIDLARATGIRPNTINELYHEIAESIKFEHLYLICKALNCDPEELIEIRIDEKDEGKFCRTNNYKGK